MLPFGLVPLLSAPSTRAGSAPRGPRHVPVGGWQAGHEPGQRTDPWEKE